MFNEVSTKAAPAGVAASETVAEDDEASADSEGTRGGLRWFPRVTLALSAFIMSLAVTLISAYYALQGPEVLVRPPEQVLLYRDGAGAQSILGFGVQLDMINGASDYGDVMLQAELSPANADVAFAFQSVLRPVFTGSAKASTEDCALGSRCIAHPGLLLVEEPDTLVDLSGGAARAVNLSFPTAQWNCRGLQRACARYATFDKAAAAVASGPLNLSIRLTFNRDGERTVRCTGGKINSEYLQKFGWATLACDESEVTGEPWL